MSSLQTVLGRLPVGHVTVSLFFVALSVASLGCTAARNYGDPEQPFYSGPSDNPRAEIAASAIAPLDPEPGIRVVTFNVEHSMRIEAAIDLLTSHSDLRQADIYLLQEMEASGVQRVAEALGFHWIYYPASVSPKFGKDFGNAIVSRWPITDPRKLILPHTAWFVRTQRTATLGTVTVDGQPIRLCSTHLALPLSSGWGARTDQLEAVASALEPFDVTIVGGDLNGGGIGRHLEVRGYTWPTRGLGATTKIFGVDHIFSKGMELGTKPPSGVVKHGGTASDHDPVWAVFAEPRAFAFANSAQKVEAEQPDSDVSATAIPIPIPTTTIDKDTQPPPFGIRQASWVDSTLLRGARADYAALARLQSAGFRTIVNLTRDGFERELVERLGMRYVEIPLTAWLWSSPPQDSQVRQFLELTSDPKARPLFFHCAQGKDRTGMMAALHRIEHEGWTNGEAIREMDRLGYHHWFDDLIQYVRTYVPTRHASSIAP